ncbi:MAG TPA: alpha/beta hydrolase [Thermomicrobiales bacterium]|nr:alpha/beta hydrolase [Thermomicrobiales bacterium]
MGTTRFAQNELARLSYEVAGPEDAPVVVLLHATMAGRASMTPLQERLAESARVIVPDARGHGGSTALTKRDLASTDLANDIVAVLDAEDISGPVHLVGHGQGAVAALELAHWRPDRIASLVLIEPETLAVLEGEHDEEIVQVREEARQANREAADASYRQLADKALNGYLDRRWGEGWRERLPKPRLAAVRRSMPALAASLDALERFRMLPEHLEGVTFPVLIVTAENTPVAERFMADRLTSWLPTAERLAVPSLPGGLPFTGDGASAADQIAAWVKAKLAGE